MALPKRALGRTGFAATILGYGAWNCVGPLLVPRLKATMRERFSTPSSTRASTLSTHPSTMGVARS